MMSRSVATRLTSLLAMLALLFAAATPALAQIDDSEIQVLGTTESDNGRVTLELAIPPSIGEVAPVAANFAIAIEGSSIPFNVRPVRNAADVMIVVDTSGSMSGEPIESAKQAAAGFISRLPDGARVGVIGFGQDASLLAPLSSDRDAATLAVAGLNSSGETALWDALSLAGDTFSKGSIDRPYVVVLSDGDDTASESSLEEAVSGLRSASAGLYAISIQTDDSQPANLETAVDAVGGQYLTTTDVSGLSALYEQIADRLASRYLIEFIPPTTSETPVVISVAVDSAIATARTVIGEGTAAGTEAEQADEASPTVLNVDPSASLSSGIIGEAPGLFGGMLPLILGIGAIFVALLLIGFSLASQSIDVRAPTAVIGRAGTGAKDVNASVKGAADRLVASRDDAGDLDAALDTAGINLRPGEFLLMTIVWTVLAGLFFAAIGGPVIGVAGILGAMVATYLYVTIKISRQRKAFADQLPDALSILTGSLKAGRGLPQAIELVAQEAPSPMGDQFRRIVFETRVGRDMTQSIQSVADRMKNQDLHWVTRAIDINRELGGDLVEVLENVADTIRDRRRIARQVQALSAEGRASGWVLIALPFVMFAFLAWRTPENADLMLTHPTGRLMMGIALAGILGGYLWVRKLVDLKY